jgi:hypothetical protein
VRPSTATERSASTVGYSPWAAEATAMELHTQLIEILFAKAQAEARRL